MSEHAVLKEFAELLNGRLYGNEITKQEAESAKALGVVVMFGASDDLVELRGAIEDEVGAYNGTTVLFDKGQLYSPECEDETCPHEEEIRLGCKTVKACWDRNDIAWTFETDIPHRSFCVMEDGVIFCRGIVFMKKDLL